MSANYRESIQQFWKPYISLFHVLCLTRVESTPDEANISKRGTMVLKIYQSLTTILVTTIILVAIINGIIVLNRVKDEYNVEGILHLYIDSFDLLINFLTFLAIHLEPIWCIRNEKQFRIHLNKIDKMMRTHLKLNIKYDRLHSKCISNLIKCVIITLLLHLLSLFFNVTVFILTSDFIYKTIVLFTTAMIRVRIFQILLYIELLCEYLSQIHIALAKHAQKLTTMKKRFGTRLNPPFIIGNELFYCHQIYSELNLIPRHLSATFGWSLLITIFQNLIEFTTSFFWVFLTMKRFTISMVLRKLKSFQKFV